MRIEISKETGLIKGLDPKQYMITEKNKKQFSTPPDTIIIHFTAGSSAVSSAKWLTKEDTKASAHIVIGDKGEIYQIVSFQHIAWHAGQSSYGGRSNFNNFSIGIELDNPGMLTRSDQKFLASFGTEYPPDRVIEAVHRNEKTPRYWHTYSAALMKACEELCTSLIATYPTIKQILGHEEISPGRKQDPGPAFPLDTFRKKLLP